MGFTVVGSERHLIKVGRKMLGDIYIMTNDVPVIPGKCSRSHVLCFEETKLPAPLFEAGNDLLVCELIRPVVATPI